MSDINETILSNCRDSLHEKDDESKLLLPPLDTLTSLQTQAWIRLNKKLMDTTGDEYMELPKSKEDFYSKFMTEVCTCSNVEVEIAFVLRN